MLKLAEIYNQNADDLLVLFLSDRILCEIRHEKLGEKALKVAKKKVKFLKFENKDIL